MKQLDQLRKGSTNLLVLSILQRGRRYGYEIMREIEVRSQGYFTMTAALLYPTLRRLEEKELVQSEWLVGDNNRRRKYYTLTDKGSSALTEQKQTWHMFTNTVNLMIQTTTGSTT